MFRRSGRFRDRVLQRGWAGNSFVAAGWTDGAGSEDTTMAGITRGRKSDNSFEELGHSGCECGNRGDIPQTQLYLAAARVWMTGAADQRECRA